ncbi:DUF4190 and DUF4352 domain-containing protein [Streptomyces sp. fd1-xmd]|uniref:DUF4190 and DUF4352 domain-containing protein n=1 Tax=Streptomyces sp. fd1-xmd TaxID=1812480 RepID=UPI000990375B|nr:DUF4190 and DUF4352 domain-containing protein [Streptomyces sp. fd1-xmd]AQT72238.1 hypothetical protein B1K54_11595 [Streptomyces sp. fd1-xmd]
MTTPPNPPSTPSGPPTEPAGTPAPEAAPIPAPAQPLSLEKTAAPEPASAPDNAPAPETPTAAAAPETAAPEAASEAASAAEAPTAEPAPAPSAFAPPTPATPAPQAPAAPAAPFGTPGVPADPWAQPVPGYAAAPYGGYPQAGETTNGLAVATLIVGGFGVVLAFVPFLFWLGGILAVTGVGLGIGAIVRANKGAPNKSMAVIGTVLAGAGILASVGGFFLTVSVMERTTDRIEAGIDDFADYDPELDGPYPSSEPWPSGSAPASPSPSQVPGLTSALPFGETYTYPNGVKVSLSKPTKYEPKGIIAREQVKNAIQITITITNGSTAPHEVIYAVPNVRDDKGMTAEMVFDTGGGSTVPKMVKGSILPGESASGVVAFEIPEGTGSITADIAAGTLLDDVKYAGPIG